MPRRRFKFFGARRGRSAARDVVRSALERSRQEPQILKNLTRALEYTKFEPTVGIRLADINLENFSSVADQLPAHEAEELRSALMKWISRGEQQDTVRFRMESFSLKNSTRCLSEFSPSR